MKQPKDPIAEAWKQSHKTALPAVLQQTAIQRAGSATAAMGKKGKGKHLLAVCASLVLGIGLAQAATVTLNYAPPIDFTDNSPIPSTDAITYNVYLGSGGTGSESATPVQTGVRYSSASVSNYTATAGENVCAYVTAVVNGVESPHSSEACVTVSGVPGAPTNLTIKVGP